MRRDSDSSGSALGSKLSKRLAPSLRWRVDFEGFLPQNELPDLINEQSVRKELTRVEKISRKTHPFFRKPRSPENILEMARKICPETTHGRLESFGHYDTSCRRLFAILLMIEKPSKIWQFVDEGITDADLPFLKVQAGNKITLVRNRAEGIWINCVSGWRNTTIVRFGEKQWTILAPVFKRTLEDKRIQHHYFEDEVKLPFTWKRLKTASPGGSCDMYKARIHPSHHNFGDTDVCIAFLHPI